MSERKSSKIPIDTQISENLDEFVKLLVENDTDQEVSFDYVYRMKVVTNDENRSIDPGSKVPKGHSYRQAYCCYCADKSYNVDSKSRHHNECYCDLKLQGKGGTARYN